MPLPSGDITGGLDTLGQIKGERPFDHDTDANSASGRLGFGPRGIYGVSVDAIADVNGPRLRGPVRGVRFHAGKYITDI
jgi:hypothetical protein